LYKPAHEEPRKLLELQPMMAMVMMMMMMMVMVMMMV
jgi:hypothetical protein